MNLFENRKLQFPTAKKYINGLQINENIDGFFKILGVQKKNKKDGSAFLTLELMDKTGKIPAKAWNNAELYFKQINEGKIYRINGTVTQYQELKEIKIDSLRPANENEFDPNDFEEIPHFDTHGLFKQMMTLIKTHVTNPYLIQLSNLFATRYGEKFEKHYGAQKIHHAYLGGLMEHTFSIMKLAVTCADHYRLDKELLVISALFHDIGKMFEFTISPAVDTTLEGGLLGHIMIGNNIFLDLKNQIPNFPPDLACQIQHLIISHHGEKEFGSPEVPKTAEAFVLHILDLLDSRVKIVEETVNNFESKGIFTDYNNILSRRLYISPNLKKNNKTV